VAEGPELRVASLLDLAGMKAAVVTQRAELRDYLDIHALLTHAKIELPVMLAAARVIYGVQFNPLVCLKALAYHDDAALAALPAGMRRDLVTAIQHVDLKALPEIPGARPRTVSG
jgi:hypothetical protein